MSLTCDCLFGKVKNTCNNSKIIFGICSNLGKFQQGGYYNVILIFELVSKIVLELTVLFQTMVLLVSFL